MKKILLIPSTQTNSKEKNLINIPPSIGTGSIEIIHLNYGIRLVIADYSLNQPTILECGVSGTSFGFGFCLSGTIESHPPYFKESFFVKKGQSGFFSFPDTLGYTEIIGLERVIRISILMDLDQMSAFVMEYPDQFMSVLINISETSFRFPDMISQPMWGALDKILHCPYHGLTRKFFIEGKVMELIAYKMEQLEIENWQNPEESVLAPNEADCVCHAARLLTHDLENAPGLIELARSVGMCRSKLHHCFCKFHGISPFEYLRNHRLEAARRLLNEGKMNVTEIAYKVGYRSLSHFSKVFKQYFGCPPGKCLKNAVSLSNRRLR
ncbi:helix-turn-helix transcriptional regulator [Desulfobacula toluolica]|nr:AraC family transcriptional regulator [Desulfobacula toluolica]